MDYLDAHQTARLECLKLLAARRASIADILAAADAMARFIIDGTVPDDDEGGAACGEDGRVTAGVDQRDAPKRNVMENCTIDFDATAFDRLPPIFHDCLFLGESTFSFETASSSESTPDATKGRAS